MWTTDEIRPLEPYKRQFFKTYLLTMKRIIEKLSNKHSSFVDSQMKVKEVENIWQCAAKMFFQGMWEQQSRSHGSVSGTAKVTRTAGNPFSLQQTPDVHISSALSPSLFFFSISLPLSPVKGWKKELATLCSSCEIGCFCCQLLSCAFPRFVPDVANLEWRWESYAVAI